MSQTSDVRRILAPIGTGLLLGLAFVALMLLWPILEAAEAREREQWEGWSDADGAV